MELRVKISIKPLNGVSISNTFWLLPFQGDCGLWAIFHGVLLCAIAYCLNGASKICREAAFCWL
jgi:hypothetical protein